MKSIDILALEEGAEADINVSTQLGYRIFNPTQHIVTAYELEEIAYDDGLYEQYASALKAIVIADSDLDADWLLAHATPLQRSKAYLMLYAT